MRVDPQLRSEERHDEAHGRVLHERRKPAVKWDHRLTDRDPDEQKHQACSGLSSTEENGPDSDRDDARDVIDREQPGGVVGSP